MPDEPLLECRRVSVQFGDVTALADVDFALRVGEVHGLLGDAGAGKSTLANLVAGALPDYQGDVRFEGRQVRMHHPRTAQRLGIGIVWQQGASVGRLSVAENVFLGCQPTTRFGTIDWEQMQRDARERLAELQIAVDVARPLDTFPPDLQRPVELARGVHCATRVLILDEPSNDLTPAASRRLAGVIELLRYRGVGVMLAGRAIDDVLEVSDRVTVLQSGRVVERIERREFGMNEVIRALREKSSRRETQATAAGG